MIASWPGVLAGRLSHVKNALMGPIAQPLITATLHLNQMTTPVKPPPPPTTPILYGLQPDICLSIYFILKSCCK